MKSFKRQVLIIIIALLGFLAVILVGFFLIFSKMFGGKTSDAFKRAASTIEKETK